MLSTDTHTLELQPKTQTGHAPFGGTLDDWLAWQNSLHTCDIALGLDRVRTVARRMGVLQLGARCVIVAGTNGKGSCVRLLESLLQARGRRVGAYTSPHLWRYNERVRIEATQADDASLCTAFAAVESARDSVPLTYFEFGTLAALWLFRRAELDYVLLEVGLGGRLDAVNIMDADVALITNIGLDHTALLGETREQVGTEKAGVMRTGRPVVSAEREPPQSVIQHAEATGAPMVRLGESFDMDAEGWWGWSTQRMALPQPLPSHVLPANLSASLAVVTLLGERPESVETIQRACQAQHTLHGRCELVDDGNIPVIYDVGHNVEAVAPLMTWLRDHPITGATHVVIGMLADKPVEQVAHLLACEADDFYTADLAAVSNRGLDAESLARRIGHAARPAGQPDAALARARRAAETADRIVVCGSFFMIAHARKAPC